MEFSAEYIEATEEQYTPDFTVFSDELWQKLSNIANKVFTGEAYYELIS